MSDQYPLGIDRDSLQDPSLTDNSETVLVRNKYLRLNEDGEPVEDPKDLFWRVAADIAKAERNYGATETEIRDIARHFYEAMATGRWMPNSPTLYNAGRDLSQLSACFVLPVEDDMGDIYDTLRNMALIHQTGGGTGFGFSRLRERGSYVSSTDGEASGPVSFMRVYDASTEAVKQGGKRRGANMGILRVDHPDILEFIDCKQDTDAITNFNISVAVTDEFMEKAFAGEDYDLVSPKNGEVVGQLNAKDVLDKIIDNAHATGEPGLFFVDKANKFNPVPHLGDYEATNPCGEQPLLPYDVCNLGHVNIAKFVEKHPGGPRVNPIDLFDEEAFKRQVHLGMRFLDNVIDRNDYPLDEIRDLSDRIRRVGHGVMGLADALIKMRVPYDSKRGREIAEYIAQVHHTACINASANLAESRGTFPEWEQSIWGPDKTCARDENGERIRPEIPLRNCNTNTVAPTGTTSIIAGCSASIEPLYAVSFYRNQAGTRMAEVHREFKHFVSDDAPEDWQDQLAEAGHFDFEWVDDHAEDIFRTAHDVAPEEHIRMQAVWQPHIDSAISKTINFAHDASKEDVREGYELAFNLDCKGVTVYRDQTREGQALETGAGKDNEDDVDAMAQRLQEVWKRDRPSVLDGSTRKIDTPHGTLYVVFNYDEYGPFEVFFELGKSGGAVNAHMEALGRAISTGLRHGVPLTAYIEQLAGISSGGVGFGPNKVESAPDGFAQLAAKEIQENGHADKEEEINLGSDSTIKPCPECGTEMQMIEGCKTCPNPTCGVSECG